MENFENFLKVTEYTVEGNLPDLFTFNNGEKVKTADDWQKRRKEMYKTAIELQYGKQPPAPEFLDICQTCDTSFNIYRITTGTCENPITFSMYVKLPKEKKEKYPFVITGDYCWTNYYTPEMMKLFSDNDIALALFDRTSIAPDNKNEAKNAVIYKAYPDCDFGAIGAWAWGYSRCLDALEKLGIVDMSCVTFSGHSRGAKTAMLAGVLDTRATIVHPNATCQGACSSYRVFMKAVAEDGVEYPSEKLENLLKYFDFWMGPKMQDYVGKEEELPFDSHSLKAMVAPRTLVVTDAASDIWANPIGTWMTTMAATEVYKFLGVPEKLYWGYRTGFHLYDIRDVQKLISVINHERLGTPVQSEGMFNTPFVKPEPIYTKAPEKE